MLTTITHSVIMLLMKKDCGDIRIPPYGERRMKKFYMVQASNTYSGNGFKAAYLPYAAGLITAAALEDEKIRGEYDFEGFVFRRQKPDKVVSQLNEPYVVGFSNYIWNTQYNLALAKKIKNKYPDCKIIFGGHNVPPDTSFLEKYSFIDFLIHGEGEEAFRSLLLEFCSDTPDYSQINNVSYRTADGYASNPTVILERIDYPSPYLTGLFDKIFEENPDMQLDAILETSRGCPRSCAYCDWGCNSHGIKLYPLERIYAEIDWFADHGVKFIWGADANFGAYERDMDIVDYFIEVRQKTGLPERLRTNYAKNQPERVLEITRKLEKYGLSKLGATLSFQSLDPDVLKNIGRSNIDMGQFSELLDKYRNDGIATYSELILGLPGETYESFCKGIGTLLTAGQHELITVYNCELLPNSPMAQPGYMKKHGIRTVEIDALMSHTDEEDGVKEKTVYVIGSDAMSNEDWISANIFSCFIESYHHLNLLKAIAIYLNKACDVAYELFYNEILSFAKSHKNSVAHSSYEELYGFFEKITNGITPELFKDEMFGNITWVPKRVPFLKTIPFAEKFFEEIRPIILWHTGDEEITNDIIRFTKTTLKNPFRNNFSETLNYNWVRFFKELRLHKKASLLNEKIKISVNNKNHRDNWKDYAVEAVWFGKSDSTINPDMQIEEIE